MWFPWLEENKTEEDLQIERDYIKTMKIIDEIKNNGTFVQKVRLWLAGGYNFR